MISEVFFYEVVIVLLAGFVHGSIGLGFPMIATPLLATFMDLKKAVLYTLLPSIIVNGSSIRRNNSFIDIWKEYKKLIFSVLVGSFIGSNILVVFYSDYYKLVLVFVTLLYLNGGRFKISLAPYMENHASMVIIIMGLLSGIVGGIANFMVPVLIILILELKLEKKKSIGVMNFCFIANKFIQVAIFGFNGNFNADNLLLIIPLVFVALFGFFIGSKIQDKIDEKLYKKVLNVTLWILSFYLVFSLF
ncbi:MAG: sulfite exporter TauE/SafE family protein [Campylobacteraceae bacterium]|nr:sulfite exporter TauE/SafE family protein [Campylobacteraceae bacterium]